MSVAETQSYINFHITCLTLREHNERLDEKEMMWLDQHQYLDHFHILNATATICQKAWHAEVGEATARDSWKKASDEYSEANRRLLTIEREWQVQAQALTSQEADRKTLQESVRTAEAKQAQVHEEWKRDLERLSEEKQHLLQEVRRGRQAYYNEGEEMRTAQEKLKVAEETTKNEQAAAESYKAKQQKAFAEIKAKLTEKGLRLSGKKAVLIERLRESERHEAEAASTETAAAESNPAAASEEPASAT